MIALEVWDLKPVDETIAGIAQFGVMERLQLSSVPPQIRALLASCWDQGRELDCVNDRLIHD